MQQDEGQWGVVFVDDAARVRLTASAIVSAALGVQATATQVRSSWLGLRTAYRAPEAGMVLGVMDVPLDRSVTQLSRVRALRDLLWAYADRLDHLGARWVETSETAAFLAECAAAEAECADAIAALIGPVASSPAAPPSMATTSGGGANPDGGVEWNRPDAWQRDPVGSMRRDWLGFRPPDEDDAIARALYGYGLLTFAGSTQTTWVMEVDYNSRAAPHPRDLKTTKAVQRWSTVGAAVDRAALGLTFVTAARSEWRASDSHRTGERLGRSLTMGTATTAGAWAGGHAGVWAGGAVGTAVFPGVGTAIGAVMGGVVGGFAGSEVGSWAGEQVVDIGGQVGDFVGDRLAWAGDVSGDTLDTMAFWD
ncbi:MAG: hypothetical protein WA962_09595 [Ornithinimicrobium sp.]